MDWDPLFLGLGYSVTSATLSVVNKWALVGFPHSGTLTLIQFAFASVSVRLLAAFGILETELLDWRRARLFAPAVLMYYLSVACNMRLLTHATVDTFVVCRSIVPIFTQAGEVVILKKSFPSSQAFVCLVMIAVGAWGYASHNSNALDSEVLAWAVLYVCCISTDMLVVKQIVSSVELSSWGYVYYNNTLALLCYPVWLLVTGETVQLSSQWSLGPVLVSAAIGLGISFFGLNTRKVYSATAFTVIGAACKFLSIIINTACWSRHAPLQAIPWLCVSLAGSILYHQAHIIKNTNKGAKLPPQAPSRRCGMLSPSCHV